MSERPLLTLIIAIYNKAENLKMVLAACSRQTLNNFEVVIADDGSGDAIIEAVEIARKNYSFHVSHVWHEDRGWRKNAILNKAIRSAQSDYIVFIDGDCIPHSRFIEDHWSEREEMMVLCGRRVLMSERWFRQITLEKIYSRAYERIGLTVIWDGITGRASNIQEGIRFESQFLRTILHRKVRGVMGCNFSLHKRDIEAVNGFDEMYDGPGFGEDSDIQFRLGLIGIKCKPLRHKAVQFHIYHMATKVSQACIKRFEEVKSQGDYWCQHGLLKNKPYLRLIDGKKQSL